MKKNFQQFLLAFPFALLTMNSLQSSPAVENKFTFIGDKAKTPVSIELEAVEYRAKQMNLYLKITNHSSTGIDFSKANWKVVSGNQSGFIKESEFDGLRIQPNTKRYAHIVFAFDEISKSGFLNERKNGTTQVDIENIQTFNNKTLPKIVLKNY